MEHLIEQDKTLLIERVCIGVIEDYSRRGVSGIDASLIAEHVCKAVYGELLQARVNEIRDIVRMHMAANNAVVLAKGLA
jgi:hypothetical protein